MVIVHGTERFRSRIRGAPVEATDRPTGPLGSWYATVLWGRPAAALFVNEATLLPVFIALAPGRTLLARLPGAVAAVLTAHRVPAELIAAEATALGTVRLAPTASSGLIGVMNEFAALAGAFGHDQVDDLVGLSVQLASTPCRPLYGRKISPDRELAALVAQHTGNR